MSAQIVARVRHFIMSHPYRPTEVVYDAFNDEVRKKYHMEMKMEVFESEEKPEILQEIA